ncbi:trypsin-like cysteine/serine peptidase domain-containing protein [Globomyces pollinis-pini]|nr:trypsin-like cysteine/serine peptidase domain-containing protein [Globomyces pollinis-pini]
MWYQTTRIYQRMIQMKPSTIKYPIRLTTLKYLTISTCSFILGYHYQQHWILQAQIQSQIKKKSNPYNFIADATEKVLDSVVNISVVNETSKLFSSKTIISSGSGFFIDKSGSILTNAHVVADVSTDTKVTVTTSDGVEYKAFVYSLDVLSDLAILKLHTTIPTKFNPVTFGSLEHIRPGDWVIAIGCPFGLQNTVTCGIVSSRNRKSNEIGGQDYRVRYLQTDCVVHSGSSGGPLVNLDGKVIGINTTRAESEGISFAIRIDSTFDMIQQLLRQGKVMRPYLGLQMISLSPNVWKQLTSKQTAHLPKIGQGVLVTKVTFPTLINRYYHNLQPNKRG